jgi:FMN phosphatase YigB (HAD superfamily)
MISFVYFDVGGVVIADVNGTDKWTKMKRDMGITAKNDIEFDQFYDEHEKEVCLGRDVDTIIPLIKEKFNVNLPTGYSLLADFINRFEQNKYIQPVLDKVKQDCGIGLLTNMYPGMFSAIKVKGIMPKVNWDVVIDSSIEGYRKPDLKIFELAQEKANTERKTILFVDNKFENINVAKDFGWQTFFYNSKDHKKSCSDLLDYYTKMGHPDNSFL